jgi:WD40 repeat protein
MAGKALIDELVMRWEELRARGDETSVEELCRDHPELIGTVESAINRLRAASEEATSEWSTDANAPAPSGPPSATSGAFVAGDDDTEGQGDGLGPPQRPDEIGRLGSFRVIKLLGSGGMGSVFQAVDSQLGRFVALKVLRPRLAGSKVARQRFLREARAAAKLEHDHVVAIYQVGEDNGVPYLAMPLLRGQSLHNQLQGGARLAGPEALRIGREIAEGLAAAHAQGLIHRDVKPGNVWIEEGTGRVKILDFGLARSAEDAGRLTQDGTILGTPAFMAPEQAMGGRQVDHRSDLFSLGCVLYRMVTGRAPFAAGSNAAVLLAIARSDPVPPRELNPEVPAGLSDLILQLLAKDPAARPQTARAVVEAIRALEHSHGAGALTSAIPSISIDIGEDAADSLVLRPAPRARTAARRPPRWWVVAGLAGVLLFGGVLAAINGLPWLREAFYDEGTLVLQSPSPAVAVAVKREGRLMGVLDPGAGPVLRLESGTYELVLSDSPQPLALASDRVTLKRGERKLVRVVPVPSARPSAVRWPAPPASIEPWPSPPDDDDGLPGLIPHPAVLAGLGRWQIETRRPRKSLIALAWSPDRRLIACASTERLVRIYETTRFDLVRVLVGDKAPISAVAWSPDGQQLATGSEDGTVQLWAADGTPGQALRGHIARVTGLAWSRDGKQLASASLDTKVRLWDRDGKPGPVLAHPDRVNGVSWSSDGTRLATASDDKNVRLWSADGTLGRVLSGHTQSVIAVAWSPDGKRIASAGSAASDRSSDPTVRLWSAFGTPGPVLKGHAANVTALAWSPDSKRIASASEDKSIRLWSADGTPGKVIWGFVPIHCMVWSPDGDHVASGGGTQLRIWALDGTPGATFVGYPEIESVAVRPDGLRLASARRNSPDVLLWGPDGKADTVLKGHTRDVAGLAWSPDGTRIATGSADATARIWAADGTPGPLFPGHVGEVLAVAWSPDGARIASASRDKTVRIWNTDGTAGPVLSGNAQDVFSVAWSPSGKQVASAGRDGTVRLWDADGTSRPHLGRFPGPSDCVAWSPDGIRIGAGDRRGDLQLWSAGGASGPALRGNGGRVTAIAWHPDSARLAVGSAAPGVSLWDINGVRGPVLAFDPESDASMVAWAARGAKLVAAGHAGSVRVWNGRTLEPEWISFQTAPLDVVAFSASGRLLRSTPSALREFVYLVDRPGHGVETLTHEAFEKRAGKANLPLK